jgi:hypothetical protein
MSDSFYKENIMSTIGLSVIPPINKKALFILWGACILGFIAIIPYSYTLNGMTLTSTDLLSTGMLVSSVQNILLFGLLIWTGLYVARRVCLGTPILDGLVKKESVGEKVRKMFLPALLIGIIGAILILLLDSFVFGPPLEAELRLLGVNLPDSVNPPAWQGFLASFYGGIDEEVLLRLFVMTLIGAIGARIYKKMDQKLPVGIFWVANILAAVLFGLGHLPTTAAIGMPMDFLVITRAIVLNGLLGIGFGWLYWKYGLESAMLSHFSADIVLHVLAPLVAVWLA